MCILLMHMSRVSLLSVRFFVLNDPATTEIYTLSLHDALPISSSRRWGSPATSWSCGTSFTTRASEGSPWALAAAPRPGPTDRKSTRLNSSHMSISYAVFCLKKKKTTKPDKHIHCHHQTPLTKL